MSPIVSKTHKTNGARMRAVVAPANLMAEPRFGVLDALLVAGFMTIAGCLIYLILG